MEVNDLLKEFIEKAVRKNADGYAGVGLPEQEIQQILSRPFDSLSQSTLLDALTMAVDENKRLRERLDKANYYIDALCHDWRVDKGKIAKWRGACIAEDIIANAMTGGDK